MRKINTGSRVNRISEDALISSHIWGRSYFQLLSNCLSLLACLLQRSEKHLANRPKNSTSRTEEKMVRIGHYNRDKGCGLGYAFALSARLGCLCLRTPSTRHSVFLGSVFRSCDMSAVHCQKLVEGILPPSSAWAGSHLSPGLRVTICLWEHQHEKYPVLPALVLLSPRRNEVLFLPDSKEVKHWAGLTTPAPGVERRKCNQWFFSGKFTSTSFAC